jgi:hypothetical protein
MRTIQISIDVFAAIWRMRKEDEPTEDAVLRRVLALPKTSTGAERDLSVQVGFHDPRYGVQLPPDFRIFRTYHGKDYSAQAVQGFWVLNTNRKGYGSLNELNSALGIEHENAWAAWFYRDENGRRRPASDLREPSKIVRRGRKADRERILARARAPIQL